MQHKVTSDSALLRWRRIIGEGDVSKQMQHQDDGLSPIGLEEPRLSGVQVLPGYDTLSNMGPDSTFFFFWSL